MHIQTRIKTLRSCFLACLFPRSFSTFVIYTFLHFIFYWLKMHFEATWKWVISYDVFILGEGFRICCGHVRTLSHILLSLHYLLKLRLIIILFEVKAIWCVVNDINWNSEVDKLMLVFFVPSFNIFFSYLHLSKYLATFLKLN